MAEPKPGTKVQGIQATKLGKIVKLGRNEPTAEMKARVPKLGRYIKRDAMRPPPVECNHGKNAGVALMRMYMNDQLGCCVISDEAHGLGVWSAADGSYQPLEPTDQEVKAKYQKWCGPGDNGCYMIGVKEQMMREGLNAAGAAHKIDGFCSLRPDDLELLKYACFEFGGLSVGFACPSEYVTEIGPNFTWNRRRGRIVGGHAVRIFGYNATGLLVSTWGVTGIWTWDAWKNDRLADEVYIHVAPSWYGADGRDTNGVSVEKLKADLAIYASGGVPDPNDDPEPPPMPTDGHVKFKGTAKVLGNSFPVELEGELSRAMERGGAASWFVLMRDLAAIASAALAKDWIALAIAVQQLLADLGVTFTQGDVNTFTNAFQTSCETSVLTDDGWGKPLDTSAPVG